MFVGLTVVVVAFIRAANQRTWYRLYMKEKEEGLAQVPPFHVYSIQKEERIVALNALGFDWAPPRPSKAKKAAGSKPNPASKAKKAGSTKGKRKAATWPKTLPGYSDKSSSNTTETTGEEMAKETATKEAGPEDSALSAPEASDEVAV